MKIGQNRAPDLKIHENFISLGTLARFYRPQGPWIDDTLMGGSYSGFGLCSGCAYWAAEFARDNIGNPGLTELTNPAIWFELMWAVIRLFTDVLSSH